MYGSGIQISGARRPVWTALLAMIVACELGSAQDLSLESAGLRAGASPTSNGHDFHQFEAFVNANLPWHWDLGKDWWLQTRLDFSAGYLGRTSEDTAVVAVGPSILARRDRLPFSLEAGSRPTFHSDYDLGTKNFGEPFQFTTHVGVNLDLGAHIRLGYQFQHMSNAGIDGHNPGLNLHMLKLSYLF